MEISEADRLSQTEAENSRFASFFWESFLDYAALETFDPGKW